MSTERPPAGLYRVVAFGCKVSRIEARSAARDLERRGLRPAEPDENPEVVVVHGCTVTQRADRDVRKEIRRLRRENPRATLVVSGCLSRRDAESLLRMPEVDVVDPGLSRGFGLDAPELEPGRTRAFLKIQDGCARRCSYCVIPSVRGTERSAPEEDVVAAIRRLGDAGIPEVVLSGIHLAGYRTSGGGNLVDLLGRLEDDPPPCRIRLSSLEPMEAGEELIDFITSSRIVVPHLHLPLQSGSDAVLARMRRGIRRSRYDELARRATGAERVVHLATDVIAGFPGETEQEFEETRAFLSALPVASVHVFSFSARPGTPAEALHRAAPVPPDVCRRRAAVLRAIGDEKRALFVSRVVGSVADVVGLRNGRGLTEHYLEVAVGVGETITGRRFPARLEPGVGKLPLRAVPFSCEQPVA